MGTDSNNSNIMKKHFIGGDYGEIRILYEIVRRIFY